MNKETITKSIENAKAGEAQAHLERLQSLPQSREVSRQIARFKRELGYWRRSVADWQ